MTGNPDGTPRRFSGTVLGFNDNCVQTIVAAPDGTLWLGCGGVAHVRPSGDKLQTLGFYNRDDGLGMGVVRALMVDTDGSIWAGGTPDRNSPPPLSHFDGKKRENGNPWRTDEPLVTAFAREKVDPTIQSLLRSRDGAFWIGLHDDGIMRWDGRNWTRFGPSQGVGRAGDADKQIRRLLQDSNGTIWAAASDQGLLRFDPGPQRWTQVAASANVPIRAIAQFADSSLWACGDALVARSTAGGQSWTLVGTSDALGNDIGGLVQDTSGRVWAGAYDNGISVWDGNKWQRLQ